MRLLRLPQGVKDALLQGRITEGHARALLMLDEDEEQLLALRAIEKKKLSVRQAEELVRRFQAATQTVSRQRTRSPETEALEGEFRDALGTR
jgi:ParB family chromosome partitioning protein